MEDMNLKTPKKPHIPQKHTVRTRDGGTITLSVFTRGKAIKVFCTECMGWDMHPKECTDPHCPLYPYRGQSLATQRGE